jgi:hypothetical protein
MQEVIRTTCSTWTLMNDMGRGIVTDLIVLMIMKRKR